MIKIINMDVIDGLATLKDESIQCVVTSPPYWALRDYGVERQIGLEPTPDEYILKMVDVFREVRRVLRADGTAWVNMGDSYGQQRGSGFNSNIRIPEKNKALAIGRIPGLKPKDLIGMPWRLAIALQADGWYLRSDIIWHKPNPMPESVADRPTKSHEYIFLLTKSAKYYYDAESIMEDSSKTWNPKKGFGTLRPKAQGLDEKSLSMQRTQFAHNTHHDDIDKSGRNKRTVWTIPTSPYPEAHFATFPPALPEICIKAGTSEKGCCPECGAPWDRVVERKAATPGQKPGYLQNCTMRSDGERAGSFTDMESKTTGWQPTCDHIDPNLTGCTALDPFSGAGTTGLVAARLGRSYIGIEINKEYAEMSAKRIKEDNPLFNQVEIIGG